MAPETIARLAGDFKNIIGVKEAAGSIPQASKILQLCGMDFLVLSGEDALNFPLLAVGARGFISVTANIAPKDVADVYNLFSAGEFEKAKDMHYKLLPLNEALFIETNPIPIKAALSMMDKIKYEYRLPLSEMTEAHYQELKKTISDYGLIK